MASGQLVVFGFLLACVRMNGARFLSMREPTYWGVKVEVQPAAEPERELSRESTQQAGMLQTKQFQARQLQSRQLQDKHLQDKQLQARQLQARQLQARQLQDKHLQDKHLQDKQLQARQLQDKHLQDKHLQDKQLQARQLQSRQLQSRQPQDKQLQDKQLQSRQLQSRQLQARQLQARQLQARQLQARQLQARQLQDRQLQDKHLQAKQLQSKQLQPAVEPLTWKFPEDPVDSVLKPPVKFELRQPVTSSRAAVRCGESRVQVEVSQDLLGLGRLIEPEDLTLGGCPATEIDSLSHVLVFESELRGCGSTLVMTENAFVYAFMLVYNPKVSVRSPIMRSQSAVIGVECHYPTRAGPTEETNFNE